MRKVRDGEKRGGKTQDLSKYTVPKSFVGMAVPTKIVGMIIVSALPTRVVGMKYVFYNIATMLTFCILSSECTKRSTGNQILTNLAL